MRKNPILILFVLAASLGVTAAQAQKNAAEIKRVDAYARSIDRTISLQKEPDLLFADIASEPTDTPKWKAFESTTVLDKFRESSETYTTAENWKLKNKLVASHFTMFDESGDWTRYVNHYFRPDGSLAKVRREIRTFYGEYIIIESIYFSPKGRRLKRTIRYLDLFSHKPKKPAAGILVTDPAEKPDYFMRTGELPFAQLLPHS